MAPTPLPDVVLSNGVRMPVLGFGTYQGSLWSCDEAVVEESVRRAIDAGYRAVETGLIVHTEPAVGRGVNHKISEGVVKREDLFIITKLWCTAHRRQDVIPALKKTLASMRLSYIDLFLIHYPVALKSTEETLYPKDDKGNLIFADDEIDYTETWQGMEDALSAGLTRTIGLANFNQRQIQRVLHSCKVKPMSLHIESNPYMQNTRLIEFCRSNDIPVTGFTALGQPARDFLNDEGAPYVATDPVLNEIGAKYGKTPQQVALRFQVQRGISILVKTNTPNRMIENQQIFDFNLSDQEMKQISSLDRNFRVISANRLRASSEYPFAED